jgi:hypothetical protein
MTKEERYQKACEFLIEELKKAEAKHPNWPDDVIHASAIINEEAGELTQAALQYCYEGGESMRIWNEAVQVGAMALRFMLRFDQYFIGDDAFIPDRKA